VGGESRAQKNPERAFMRLYIFREPC
jgi:hypothetical protein